MSYSSSTTSPMPNAATAGTPLPDAVAWGGTQLTIVPSWMPMTLK
jgi:hypothetical protein